MTLFSTGQNLPSYSIDELAVKLIRTLRTDVSENIFIHTDKSVYKAGEDIWFNLYLINKTSHKISHQSRIVFVDLVNEKDSVISHLTLDPRSLRLNGKIRLPVFLQDGNYWLRGYTFKILKTDSNDICVHPLYIVNQQNLPGHFASPVPKDSSGPAGRDTPKFEIYPEGGSLIAGVTSKVVFRITDQQDMPLEAEGYLTDNRDSIATSFKSSGSGFGSFLLFPWAKRRYTAHIKTREGKSFSFPLPAIDNYGATISVVGETENSLHVNVSLGDSLYNKKTETYLLGISGDSLCFSAIGQRMYATDIPKRNFPPGEASLLLFDEHNRLLSERSVYIDFDSVTVEIKADKERYLARDHVELDVSVNSPNSHSSLSMISVAITDNRGVRYFDDGDLENILGKPYPPAERDLMMIASKNPNIKREPADTLTTMEEKRSEDNFFNIDGRLMNQKNKALPGKAVFLIATRPENIFRTDTTDRNGHFNFNLSGYRDSTEFILESSDKKGNITDAKIVFDSVPLPKFPTPLRLKRYLPDSVVSGEIGEKKAENQDFLLSKKGKLLKEVVISSKIKKPVNYDESLRVSQFSKILSTDMIKQNGQGAITNSLLFIPGLQLRNRRLVITPNDEEPLLVIDGVEIDSGMYMAEGQLGVSPLMSFLNRFSADDIDFIEVLTGGDAAFYGMRGGNGVIIIHTRSTARYDDRNKADLTKFYKSGYSVPASFSEPDYNNRDIKRNITPDQRSTIYWAAPLITDKLGKTTLQFFTADPKATYTVTIKGITVSGDILVKRILINRR